MRKTKPICLSAGLFAALICPLCTPAQTTPLPLGQVQMPTSLSSCPVNFDTHMTCYNTAVVNCPNTLDIPLVYGYARTNASTVLGTIVMLSGGGGSDGGWPILSPV